MWNWCSVGFRLFWCIWRSWYHRCGHNGDSVFCQPEKLIYVHQQPSVVMLFPVHTHAMVHFCPAKAIPPQLSALGSWREHLITPLQKMKQSDHPSRAHTCKPSANRCLLIKQYWSLILIGASSTSPTDWPTPHHHATLTINIQTGTSRFEFYFCFHY